jgi:hypothetical protein
MSTIEITDFGFFRVIEPPPGNRVLLFENEDGLDWYEMRVALTQWDRYGEYVNAVYGAWAMVDRDGVITNVEFDPSRLMPGERTVLGIDASHEDIEPGMIWRGGELLPPTDATRERVG